VERAQAAQGGPGYGGGALEDAALTVGGDSGGRPPIVWRYPRLFAHRCGGSAAPENTLAGLRAAARAGLRAVEFDVMLTADGTAVLIHDETWERTTDAAGRVGETRDAMLAHIDAGIRFGPRFAGEPVPRLAEAAALARRLGLACNVEIKPAWGREVRTGEVVAAAAQRLWGDAPLPPLLSSFSEAALEAAARAAPGLPRGLLVEQPPADWRSRAARLGCHSLHCDGNALPLDRLADLVRSGVPVVCYTIDDPARAEALWQAGAAAVITDRIELIREPAG
jgi:glycerophosphoryl diester phosphodiesterase